MNRNIKIKRSTCDGIQLNSIQGWSGPCSIRWGIWVGDCEGDLCIDIGD